MRRVSGAKALYHRLIPQEVRNPIGLLRRSSLDRITRATASVPLPPRELLGNIQMTPWVREYLDIGERSAVSIRAALTSSAVPVEGRVLDFGCGSGRALRHLRGSPWQLHGCDVDKPAIDWTAANLRFAQFRVSPLSPPLPYEENFFDAVYAISVFTHFSPTQQRSWAEELARVIKPGGALLVSTMGPGILCNFPAHGTLENQRELATGGSIFIPSEISFNSNAAFHSITGLKKVFCDGFDLRSWEEQGLDGFQDLSVWVRR